MIKLPKDIVYIIYGYVGGIMRHVTVNWMFLPRRIAYGDLSTVDMVLWAEKQGCCIGRWIGIAAARNGNRELVKYIAKRCGHGKSYYDTYFQQSGYFDDVNILDEDMVIKYNRMDLVRELTTEHLYAAAKYGKLEIIKNIYSSRIVSQEHTTRVLCEAVLMGHTDIIIYLMGVSSPHPKLCAYAAKAGNLEMLKFLVEHGCPMDGWTRTNARVGGYMNIWKWAVDAGCPEHSPRSAQIMLNSIARVESVR